MPIWISDSLCSSYSCRRFLSCSTFVSLFGFYQFDIQPNGLLPADHLPLSVPIPSTASPGSFSYKSVLAHRLPLPPSLLSVHMPRYSGGARPLIRSNGGARSLHAPGSVRVFSPTCSCVSVYCAFFSSQSAPSPIRTVADSPLSVSSRIYPHVSLPLSDFTNAGFKFPISRPVSCDCGDFVPWR